MSRQRKQKNQSTTRSGPGSPLRLAVAAATLGMSMGISPSEVLATQQQVEQGGKEMTSVAASNVQTSDIQGKRAMQKPGGGGTGLTPKVKQPGVAYPKVERPEAAYPKVERPGAAYPKVERPGAAYPKVEQPGAAMPKLER